LGCQGVRFGDEIDKVDANFHSYIKPLTTKYHGLENTSIMSTASTDESSDIVEKTKQRAKDEKAWLERKLREKHETDE
jgi:hypothetical protein